MTDGQRVDGQSLVEKYLSFMCERTVDIMSREVSCNILHTLHKGYVRGVQYNENTQYRSRARLAVRGVLLFWLTSDVTHDH